MALCAFSSQAIRIPLFHSSSRKQLRLIRTQLNFTVNTSPLEENSIEELMFADDLVLIADDQIRLREMVSNRDQKFTKYGMRISRDKTEVMVTMEPIQCDIELYGETLRQVEQFKYLGSIFVREGGCKEDVKTRCLKAAQVFYQLSSILGHKEISMITKTQIIKAVFTPNSTLPE